MARKGVLPRGVKIEPFLKNGTSPRCGFVTFRNRQCTKPCMRGRPRCRNHGGKAGRPIIHGKFSKYQVIPFGLVEKFEKSVTDPHLLELREEISLVRATVWEMAEHSKGKRTFDEKDTRRLLKLLQTEKELIAQEHRRQVDMELFIGADMLGLIVAQLLTSVNTHITAENLERHGAVKVRQLVAEDFREVMNKGK